LEDRRISAKSIAERLGISREQVGSIIHEDLYMRKVTSRVLFLHDNALANWALATPKKLAYLGFQCLDHPPYSPDLAPSGYHLCPGLTKQSKGRHFSSDVEVIAAAETWLDVKPSDFFFF
jgi:histone-lysine N-methyltransferase SETMAR